MLNIIGLFDFTLIRLAWLDTVTGGQFLFSMNGYNYIK